MPATVTCPNCETTVRVRDELAGKKVKCPRCAEVIAVPGPDAMTALPRPPADDVVTEVEPDEEVALVEPDAGAEGERRAKRRGEDDEGERKPRGKYKPCPECGARGAKRVEWTFWGSYYGPKLFTHVRCPECGYGYNGKTGGSNALWAALLISIPALAILAIIAVLVYILLSRFDVI